MPHASAGNEPSSHPSGTPHPPPAEGAHQPHHVDYHNHPHHVPVEINNLEDQQPGSARGSSPTTSSSSSFSVVTEDTPPGTPDMELKRQVDERRASMVQPMVVSDEDPEWGVGTYGNAVLSEDGGGRDASDSEVASGMSPVRVIDQTTLSGEGVSRFDSHALLASATGGHNSVRRRSSVVSRDSNRSSPSSPTAGHSSSSPPSWRRSSISASHNVVVADPVNDFRPMSQGGGGRPTTTSTLPPMRTRSMSREGGGGRPPITAASLNRTLSGRGGGDTNLLLGANPSHHHVSFTRSKSVDAVKDAVVVSRRGSGGVGGGASELPVLARPSSGKISHDEHHRLRRSPSPMPCDTPLTATHVNSSPSTPRDVSLGSPSAKTNSSPGMREGFYFGGRRMSTAAHHSTPNNYDSNAEGNQEEGNLRREDSRSVSRHPSFRPRLASFVAFPSDPPPREPSHDPFADAEHPIDRRHSYHGGDSNQRRRAHAIDVLSTEPVQQPMQPGYHAMGTHHEPDYIPHMATGGWLGASEGEEETSSSSGSDVEPLKEAEERSYAATHGFGFTSSGFGSMQRPSIVDSSIPPPVPPTSGGGGPVVVDTSEEAMLFRRASMRRMSMRVGSVAPTTTDGDPIVTSTLVIRRHLQTLDDAMLAFNTTISRQSAAVDLPKTAYLTSLSERKGWDVAVDALEEVRSTVAHEIAKMGQRLSLQDSDVVRRWLVKTVTGLILEGDRIAVPFSRNAFDEHFDFRSSEEQSAKAPIDGGVSLKLNLDETIGKRQVLESAARRVMFRTHGFRTRRSNIPLLSALFHHVVAGIDFPALITELNVPIWSCQNGHGRLLGLVLKFGAVREMMTAATLRRMLATSVAAMAVMGQEYVSPLLSLWRLEHAVSNEETLLQRESISLEIKTSNRPRIPCDFCRDSFTVAAAIELFYSLVTAAPFIPVCAPPLDVSDGEAEEPFGSDLNAVPSVSVLVSSPSGQTTSMSAVFEGEASRRKVIDKSKGIGGRGKWARANRATYEELQLLWQEGAEVALALVVGDATARHSFGHSSANYFSVEDMQLIASLTAPTEVFLAATGIHEEDIAGVEEQVRKHKLDDAATFDSPDPLRLMGKKRRSTLRSSSVASPPPPLPDTGHTLQDAIHRKDILRSMLVQVRSHQSKRAALNTTLMDYLRDYPALGAALQGMTKAVHYMQERLLTKIVRQDPYRSVLNVNCFTCEAPMNLAAGRVAAPLELPAWDDEQSVQAIQRRTPGAMCDGLSILGRACLRGNIELVKLLITTASERHDAAMVKYNEQVAERRRQYTALHGGGKDGDESEDTFTLDTSLPTAPPSNTTIHSAIPEEASFITTAAPLGPKPTHPCAYIMQVYGTNAFHLAVAHTALPIIRLFLMYLTSREALATDIVNGRCSQGKASIALSLVPPGQPCSSLLVEYSQSIGKGGNGGAFPTGVELATRVAALHQFVDGVCVVRKARSTSDETRMKTIERLQYGTVHTLVTEPHSMVVKSSLTYDHFNEHTFVQALMPDLVSEVVSSPADSSETHTAGRANVVGFEVLATLHGIAHPPTN